IQAEDGIRDFHVTGVQACALPIWAELGLDRPLPVQYGRWLVNFASGDWGESFSTRSDIRPVVMERLRNSLRLAFLTLLMAVPLESGSASCRSSYMTSSKHDYHYTR